MKSNLFVGLGDFCEKRIQEFDQISVERKSHLENLARSVAVRKKENGIVSVVFICTHNSRRSQIAELMGLLAAHYYSVSGVDFYSGGIEETAFHPNAVRALESCGFSIEKEKQSNNPRYLIRIAENEPRHTSFSKIYTNAFNPQKNFIAVMVCSDADENCPVVFGATEVVKLPYDDPKRFDGTSEEESGYLETCQEIARELFFVFSLLT